ncbi:MAG: hypothetical protein G3M70_10200 [Candidatus Nitronauta litoralis]|uniref:Flagellar assembly protein T C-terminal domain-containing protein n=1 Tax=Candidatus Nitronauta litoralis TaxID=2705533 RepID=A0A7T0G0V0_9BACT|nr:MAG: hypothetical protein G3M70_10200 [Candidatus Nitronauta litoralis]
MRHKTRKCLVFNYLIVMGLMALVATGPALAEPEVMAELTSGSDMLPLYRGDLEETETPASQAQSDNPMQVASRLPAPEVISKQVTAASPPTQFFNENLSLITLGEYIRSGYLVDEHTPFGSIIRNEGFWSNAINYEIVDLDIGTNKGLKPGDKLLAYLINDNFNQGFDLEVPVRHPVQSDHPYLKTRDGGVANDLWDMKIGTGETGIWKKKLEWFDELMIARGEDRGDMVRVVGILEVKQVEAEKARAQVTEMIELIPRGSFVAPYPKNLPAMMTEDFRGPRKNLSGFVMENREGYLLSSERDIVFIDLGKTHNVAPGDRFDILAAAREEKEVIRSLINHVEKIVDPEPRLSIDRVIGELVVVKVGGKSSTAMIVDGSEPILPGHRIRSKR